MISNDCESAGTTGYLHPSYVRALEEVGSPRRLERSKGCILVSAVDGSSAFDARGCYPLFCCRNWDRIAEDVESLKDSLVSLVLVIDPFGNYSLQEMAECFPDLFKPYKEHFVVDLTYPIQSIISKTHARYVRKARQAVDVERVQSPCECASEWVALYNNLITRHRIRGLAAFSERSLRKQIEVPGLEMFRAVCGGETVAMLLYYVHGGVAYYHLGASSDKGYAMRASYALFADSLAYFRGRLRWVCLGAGAGVTNDGDDGLTRFKRGWATGSRTTYICGRIFDYPLYNELVRAHQPIAEDFFPLYRRGEAV